MLIGSVAFVILLIMCARIDRAEHHAIFYDRPCGYCDDGIHFDKRHQRWVHDDGVIEKEFGKYPGSRIMHNAHPGGMLS